jgi:hypothetical protein
VNLKATAQICDECYIIEDWTFSINNDEPDDEFWGIELVDYGSGDAIAEVGGTQFSGGAGRQGALYLLNTSNGSVISGFPKYFGSSGQDIFYTVEQACNGNLIMCSTKKSSKVGATNSAKAWFLEYDITNQAPYPAPPLTACSTYVRQVRTKCSPSKYSDFVSGTPFEVPCNCISRLEENEAFIDSAALAIFPNPATISFKLSLTIAGVQTVPVRINILDQAGKIVSQLEAVVSQGFLEKEISVAELAAGSYYISLNANGKSYRRKLIIVQD